MIENHRSGLLWRLFMSCPEVRAGLDRLGFEVARRPPHERPAATGPGGSAASSTKSTRAPSRTATATASATSRGIIERADYLPWLGVDAVWISPFYPSPMADFGYDVSDFTGVDPLFGTLADFDRLVAALHARGIRVILDFVPEPQLGPASLVRRERAARATIPKRDWYVWRDPAPDGGPPNNWVSMAGGGAWAVRRGDRPVLPALLPQGAARPQLAQPGRARGDARRAALLARARRRRLPRRRAVVPRQGPRVPRRAAQPRLPRRRDPPFKRAPDAEQLPTTPDMIGLAAEMRRVIDAYPGERLLIGEIGLPVQRVMAYYGPQLDACHLPFNFALIWATWKPEAVARLIADYEARPAARRLAELGPGQPRPAARREPGRPGAGARRHDAAPHPARHAHPLLRRRARPRERPHPARQGPRPLRPASRARAATPTARPCPGTTGPNAGFTTAEPWLPLGADHPARSVAVQREDPASMLSLTRALLHLRRQEPALQLGDWRLLAADEAVLAYERRWEEAALHGPAEPHARAADGRARAGSRRHGRGLDPARPGGGERRRQRGAARGRGAGDRQPDAVARPDRATKTDGRNRRYQIRVSRPPLVTPRLERGVRSRAAPRRSRPRWPVRPGHDPRKPPQRSPGLV